MLAIDPTENPERKQILGNFETPQWTKEREAEEKKNAKYKETHAALMKMMRGEPLTEPERLLLDECTKKVKGE